jgi:hypothetical protein
MAIAVFIPELVLFCASEQWLATRRLRKEINEIGDAAFEERDAADIGYLPKETCKVCSRKREMDGANSAASSEYNLATLFQESESTSDIDKEETVNDKKKEQETWTMEQAFFALSGGFAIDSSSFSPHARITFTPPGLLFLARLGLLPNESPEAVNDKSKADYVAKVLVCIQAGWFLIQCIARAAQKLPLTLLELHVLTHVLCAFAMYLLWIQKPYDVGSPILCRDQRVVDLAALFALHVAPVRFFFYYGPNHFCGCS